MTHWIKYNPNPKGNTTEDCTIRAITKATGKSWKTIFEEVCDMGEDMGLMPSADKVWRRYLYMHGFDRYLVDDHGYYDYSVEDFCEDNPYGTYVLWIPGNNSGHVVCVVDGYYYDNWDSGQEVPEYYWTKD